MHGTLGEAFGSGDLVMLVCLTGDARSAALQIASRRQGNGPDRYQPPEPVKYANLVLKAW